MSNHLIRHGNKRHCSICKAIRMKRGLDEPKTRKVRIWVDAPD